MSTSPDWPSLDREHGPHRDAAFAYGRCSLAIWEKAAAGERVAPGFVNQYVFTLERAGRRSSGDKQGSSKPRKPCTSAAIDDRSVKRARPRPSDHGALAAGPRERCTCGEGDPDRAARSCYKRRRRDHGRLAGPRPSAHGGAAAGACRRVRRSRRELHGGRSARCHARARHPDEIAGQKNIPGRCRDARTRWPRFRPRSRCKARPALARRL